jgi:NAD(P)H-dependent FMN reductase
VTKLVGIAGSLCRGSLNAALLRAAAELAPEGVELAIGSIRGIPLYDGDLEAAEGVSVPGVLKNAVDWLSRPPADIPRVFGGRPVALIGASPGGFGTVLAQSAWLPVLRTLGAELWSGGRLLVSRAQGVFGEDGTLADQKVGEQLRTFVQGFAAFVRSSRQGSSA